MYKVNDKVFHLGRVVTVVKVLANNAGYGLSNYHTAKNEELQPFIEMTDDGERQEFSTGAVREPDKHKSRPDLIPACVLLKLGEWYGRGGEKYGARNWEKGIPNYRHEGALMRHLLKYFDGEEDEDHLSAIMFNAMAIQFNRIKLPEMCKDENSYKEEK